VGLPSTRDDARLITHADAAAMAAQVPDMNYPAPGAGGLPLPRTIVEAMSMLAFSRQQENWQNSNQPTHTHTLNSPKPRAGSLGCLWHPPFALGASNVS